MRDLNAYAKECMEMLDNIGIEYGKIKEWKINTRAHRRWGQCKLLPNGSYEISINADLLNEQNSEKGIMIVILHELLHSCKGCMNHGENWVTLAHIVSRKYGYNIKRTASPEELGLKTYAKTEYKNEYIIKCDCCNQEYHYHRMCDPVRIPEMYHCHCGGTLKRIK